LKTVGELGERRIIEIMLKHLEKAPLMAVPVGDDVSAVTFNDGNDVVVLKTDMLVGKTDVPPGMDLWHAARKTVVMNISDLASKGVKPSALLVSLGCPRSFKEVDFVRIAEGLNAGAREYDTYVVGGDTSETEDLIISVAAFGLARKERLILRCGACPGDILATTGEFGLSASGLKVLKEELAVSGGLQKSLVDAVLRPCARLKEGLALSGTGGVTASIDSSDGLAWSLHELSRSSGVGFVVDNLPVAGKALEFSEMFDFDPVELSLYGGEEYELVFTVKPDRWEEVERVIEREGNSLLRIGETTETRQVLLKYDGQIVEVEARGYEHFK
jgi:thiamine-monophosphate kinase